MEMEIDKKKKKCSKLHIQPCLISLLACLINK